MGVNDDMVSKNFLVGSELVVATKALMLGGVCEGEGVFVYLSCYLGR